MATADFTLADHTQATTLVATYAALLAESVDTHDGDAHTTYRGDVNIVHHCLHINIFKDSEHESYDDDVAQADAQGESHSAAKTMFYTVLYQAEESRPEAKEQRESDATQYADE